MSEMEAGRVLPPETPVQALENQELAPSRPVSQPAGEGASGPAALESGAAEIAAPVPAGGPADAPSALDAPALSPERALSPEEAAAPPVGGEDLLLLPPAENAPALLEEAAAAEEAEPENAEPENAEPEPPPPPPPLKDEVVTGHTASLWKYKPLPEDQPDPVPEYRTTGRRFDGGQILAARVRGKKHKHEGTHCDDWYETATLDGMLFAAVSDGAGSRRFSRVGARESCRTAAGYLRRSFAELWAERPHLAEDIALDFGDERCMSACGVLAGAVQQAVQKAREAVESAFYARSLDPAYEAALGRPLELRDLSGTLLAAAVIPAGEAGRLVITCQVGDGMIALLNTRAPFESALKLMGVPDSGEFSGETEFLTSPQMASLDALRSRTKISRGPSDLLLMMSDGVADDYFPNETELRRLYLDLLANGVLEDAGGPPTAEQLRLYKKFPAPLSYPWVNDQSVQVPLHAVRRICEGGGVTQEELWQNRGVLGLACTELGLEAAPAEERLRLWLDNYVERGSFDDRTLLIARLED